MEKLKLSVAVKRFLEKDARPIPLPEFRDFWMSLSDVDKREFSETSARELGVELELV